MTLAVPAYMERTLVWPMYGTQHWSSFILLYGMDQTDN